MLIVIGRTISESCKFPAIRITEFGERQKVLRNQASANTFRSREFRKSPAHGLQPKLLYSRGL